MKVEQSKIHMVLDLGPSTMIILAELLLIALKMTNYISVSWLLILSPIIVILSSATLILLVTFIKMVKNYIF